MVAAGNDNSNENLDNIVFTTKVTKLHVPTVTLSAKNNKKLSKLHGKGFERSVYWNEYKTKSENKNTTNEYRYFLVSNFLGVKRLFVLIYPNQNDSVKRFNIKRYYLPKGIIKNYNVIISGRNFNDQTVDSDIKRNKEIKS